VVNIEKKRRRFLARIDELDLKAELIPLNATERYAMRDANERVNKLRCNEETKWAQRAKSKHVQELDII
jgi:hypothetical protein